MSDNLNLWTKVEWKPGPLNKPPETTSVLDQWHIIADFKGVSVLLCAIVRGPGGLQNGKVAIEN